MLDGKPWCIYSTFRHVKCFGSNHSHLDLRHKLLLTSSQSLSFFISKMGIIGINGRDTRCKIGHTCPGSNSHSANHSYPCARGHLIPLAPASSPVQGASKTAMSWGQDQRLTRCKDPAEGQLQRQASSQRQGADREQRQNWRRVPSHHPQASTCLSRRIFFLALASRYRRSPSWGEEPRQIEVGAGQPPGPAPITACPPPPKGPRRPSLQSWSRLQVHSGSLDSTVPATECQPQLPLTALSDSGNTTCPH